MRKIAETWPLIEPAGSFEHSTGHARPVAAGRVVTCHISLLGSWLPNDPERKRIASKAPFHLRNNLVGSRGRLRLWNSTKRFGSLWGSWRMRSNDPARDRMLKG